VAKAEAVARLTDLCGHAPRSYGGVKAREGCAGRASTSLGFVNLRSSLTMTAEGHGRKNHLVLPTSAHGWRAAALLLDRSNAEIDRRWPQSRTSVFIVNARGVIG